MITYFYSDAEIFSGAVKMLNCKCGVDWLLDTVKGEICLIMEVAQRYFNQERGELQRASLEHFKSVGYKFR